MKELYFREATLKGPTSSLTSAFRIYTIAAYIGEAVSITTACAEKALPAGCMIDNVSVISFQRGLSEQVAQEVSRWKQPD